MSDIQTSTIRVPKNVLEDIKIYCRKAGQPIGEWVEMEKERSQVDALCKLMSEFIISQKQMQLPAPDIIAKAAEEKVRANFLEKELQQLREQNKVLQERYEKAHKELVRVQIEQKTLGKIKINTDL